MQKQLTALVQIREILIFLLIWPVLPIIINISGILMIFNNFLTPILIGFMFLYNFLGWYIAMRVYTYRIKKYVRLEKNNFYSQKKELGLFLLIWPLAPIILHILIYLISYISRELFHLTSILMMISTYWFMFGWGVALYIYHKRRKTYFQNHIKEEKQSKKMARFIPLLVVILVLGAIVYMGIKAIMDFSDDGHRDLSPKGTKIRLEISEEECQKYPNRYYFHNLCILCPDEQPLVDGHCQRCPEGQFVTSNGCRDCDYRMNFITPKAECDACSNRIYDDDLCKPLYHLSSPRACDDNGSWSNASKEDCDACPNRKFIPYTEGFGGDCELVLHGWQKNMIIGKWNKTMIVEDRFFDENGDLSIKRKFYDETHLKSETYLKEDKILTYFENGNIRTEHQSDFEKGYYFNGVLAFELKNNEAYFYNQNGKQIAFAIMAVDYPKYISECYIFQDMKKHPISEDKFLQFLKKNYQIDFQLPFAFRERKGNITNYHYFNEDAEKKFHEN